MHLGSLSDQSGLPAGSLMTQLGSPMRLPGQTGHTAASSHHSSHAAACSITSSGQHTFINEHAVHVGGEYAAMSSYTGASAAERAMLSNRGSFESVDMPNYSGGRRYTHGDPLMASTAEEEAPVTAGTDNGTAAGSGTAAASGGSRFTNLMKKFFGGGSNKTRAATTSGGTASQPMHVPSNTALGGNAPGISARPCPGSNLVLDSDSVAGRGSLTALPPKVTLLGHNGHGFTTIVQSRGAPGSARCVWGGSVRGRYLWEAVLRHMSAYSHRNPVTFTGALLSLSSAFQSTVHFAICHTMVLSAMHACMHV